MRRMSPLLIPGLLILAASVGACTHRSPVVSALAYDHCDGTGTAAYLDSGACRSAGGVAGTATPDRGRDLRPGVPG